MNRKLLEHVCENIAIQILSHSLIVGRPNTFVWLWIADF